MREAHRIIGAFITDEEGIETFFLQSSSKGVARFSYEQFTRMMLPRRGEDWICLWQVQPKLDGPWIPYLGRDSGRSQLLEWITEEELPVPRGWEPPCEPGLLLALPEGEGGFFGLS